MNDEGGGKKPPPGGKKKGGIRLLPREGKRYALAERKKRDHTEKEGGASASTGKKNGVAGEWGGGKGKSRP